MQKDDVIYRQAAIDAIDKRVQFLKDDPVFRRKHGDIDLYGIKPIIRALPSAQPEIIRCKDCKFWKKYGYINGKPEFLPKCGFNQIYTSKDDFCSRAERKNNG